MKKYVLYVKTHRQTGLKYLGQTSAANPYRYLGSGKYWLLHLKKHGKDFDTKILHECHSTAELKEVGLYYSNLWNVVESDEWANLKPESGDGGGKPGFVSPFRGKTYAEMYDVEKEKLIKQKQSEHNPMKRIEQKARITGDNNQMRRPEVMEKSVSKRRGKLHYQINNPQGKINQHEAMKVFNEKRKGTHFRKVECEHCKNNYAINQIKQHQKSCKSNLARLVANTDLDVYNH